jgi:lipoprotein-anchoring transpeptidase ErfK/SrfK
MYSFVQEANPHLPEKSQGKKRRQTPVGIDRKGKNTQKTGVISRKQTDLTKVISSAIHWGERRAAGKRVQRLLE